MKNILFIFIATALVSCTEISYKEPQPKGIKSLTKIPAKLHGKYLMDKDTVFLFENGLRGRDKDTGKETVLQIPSDTLVMKEYKGNYYLSYRDGDYWLLRILKVAKNGDIKLLSMDLVPGDGFEKVDLDTIAVTVQTNSLKAEESKISTDAKRKEFLEKISKITPVKEIDSHFIIDPSPRKLNQLLKKGFFKELKDGTLKKIP